MTNAEIKMENPDVQAAMKKMIQARTNLVLGQPFFGSLALRLKLIPDPTCKTMWTDGVSLGFNPTFVLSMTLAECEGCVCHQVMHNACGHPWRREGREMKGWNEATDFAINPIIAEAKMRLPQPHLFDPAYVGKSAEWIFSSRKQPQDQPQQSPEAGQGEESTSGDSGEQEEQEPDEQKPDDDQAEPEQDGEQEQKADGDGEENTDEGQSEDEEESEDYGCGEVRDAKGEDVQAQEADWQVATFQAAQAAQSQGKLPASLERLVEEMRKPVVDWRAALRKFVQLCARNDFTYRQPNRRYVASGLYLPALRSEQMPPVVIYWDTSGSRDSAEARAECAAEVAEIIEECKPEKTYVIYGDTQFQHVDEFEPGEEIKFNPKGGGGTCFKWIPKWIEEQGIEPVCLIGITDGYGDWPSQEPWYPVIWAMTTDVKAPFGESIKITD